MIDDSVQNAQDQYALELRGLIERGYNASITGTGGNCTAIEVVIDSTSHVLVTDREGPLPWLREDLEGWAAGLYLDEDEGDCAGLHTTDDPSFDGLLSVLSAVLWEQDARA